MTPRLWLCLERAWRKHRKGVEEVEKKGRRGSSEKKSQRGEKSVNHALFLGKSLVTVQGHFHSVGLYKAGPFESLNRTVMFTY